MAPTPIPAADPRSQRLADPSPMKADASATTTLTTPEIAKLAKTAKYELIRRGIMK